MSEKKAPIATTSLEPEKNRKEVGMREQGKLVVGGGGTQVQGGSDPSRKAGIDGSKASEKEVSPAAAELNALIGKAGKEVLKASEEEGKSEANPQSSVSSLQQAIAVEIREAAEQRTRARGKNLPRPFVALTRTQTVSLNFAELAKDPEFRSAGGSKEFRDSAFPWGDASVYGEAGPGEAGHFDVGGGWRRAREISGDEVSLLSQVSPQTIVQGQLGDCYFLAALASAAESPELIKRLFVAGGLDKGFVGVALCLGGVWQTVIVDDGFPRAAGGALAFSRGRGGELWPAVLEKAWAKLSGGYLRAESGVASEILRDLTGAPTSSFSPARINIDELWTRLAAGEIRGDLMTASTEALDPKTAEEAGLIPFHGYSLISCFELAREGGKLRRRNSGEPLAERLVLLRNPWGAREWRGDWSDSSPKWTEEATPELKPPCKDDGLFFMSFEDLFKHYKTIEVCHYRPENAYTALSVTTSDSYVFFKVSVAKPGVYYFSANQLNKRFFSDNSGYAYASIQLIIARICPEEKSLRFLDCVMGEKKELWCQLEVEPGEFLVQALCNFETLPGTFSLSVYGPGQAEILRTDPSSQPVDLLNRMLKAHASRDPSLPSTPIVANNPLLSYRFFQDEGVGYYFFDNRSPNLLLDITVDLSGSRNIRLNPPDSGERRAVRISPGSSSIIGFSAIKLPYVLSSRFSAAVNETSKDLDLIRSTLESKVFLSLPDGEGRASGVRVCVRRVPDGLFIVYSHEGKSSVLSQTLRFRLTDCAIEGTSGQGVSFSLRPGRRLPIKIWKNEAAKNFDAVVVESLAKFSQV